MTIDCFEVRNSSDLEEIRSRTSWDDVGRALRTVEQCSRIVLYAGNPSHIVLLSRAPTLINRSSCCQYGHSFIRSIGSIVHPVVNLVNLIYLVNLSSCRQTGHALIWLIWSIVLCIVNLVNRSFCHRHSHSFIQSVWSIASPIFHLFNC
jgi:hypothetical protein